MEMRAIFVVSILEISFLAVNDLPTPGGPFKIITLFVLAFFLILCHPDVAAIDLIPSEY